MRHIYFSVHFSYKSTTDFNFHERMHCVYIVWHRIVSTEVQAVVDTISKYDIPVVLEMYV